MKVHTEQTFETAIVTSLVENGYKEGNVIEFDKDAALNKEEVLQFIESSQPDAWNQITAIHKNNTNKNLIDRLLKELDKPWQS